MRREGVTRGVFIAVMDQINSLYVQGIFLSLLYALVTHVHPDILLTSFYIKILV